MTTFTKEQLIEHITRQLDQYRRLIKAQPLGDNTYNRKTISAMEIALASLTADPVLPKQPVPMAFDEAWENTGHLFIDNKQYAALFYGLGYKAALAQPAIPEQPPAEIKIGTSKHVNPYYIAQCTTCGWLGSSEDCLGDEDDCDCPLCYANAEEVDAETAFNIMLDALNKLRASTAQQNEPKNIPENIPTAHSAYISFDALMAAVSEVTGAKSEFDATPEKCYQAVPFMNFNSLSRIVEMFRTSQPAIQLAPHVYRELVNDLRDVALEYHDAQQLRERISGALSKAVTAVHPHLAQPVSEPYKLSDGRKLVPFDPAKEMFCFVRDWSIKGVGNDQATGCNQAMLAAPAQESE